MNIDRQVRHLALDSYASGWRTGVRWGIFIGLAAGAIVGWFGFWLFALIHVTH